MEITQEAVVHFKSILSDRRDKGLRIYVAGSLAGSYYALDFCGKVAAGDRVVLNDGITVSATPEAAAKLSAATIDYSRPDGLFISGLPCCDGKTPLAFR